jgi:hypothetical protein
MKRLHALLWRTCPSRMCVHKILNKNKINHSSSKLNPNSIWRSKQSIRWKWSRGEKEIQEKEDEEEMQPLRSQGPHPRVHQTIQRDHLVDMILGDIHKE